METDKERENELLLVEIKEQEDKGIQINKLSILFNFYNFKNFFENNKKIL